MKSKELSTIAGGIVFGLVRKRWPLPYATMCTIDDLAKKISTKSKREASKKLARYTSGKERDNFTSLPRVEFPLRGRRGTQLLCIGSWKHFYLLIAKCKDKRKVENFLERYRVFLDQCFGKSCEIVWMSLPYVSPMKNLVELHLPSFELAYVLRPLLRMGNGRSFCLRTLKCFLLTLL